MTTGGISRKRRFVVPTLLLGVIVLTACPETDPVNAVSDPGTGAEAISNFIISSGDGFGRPSSDYTMPALGDTYGRKTGPLGTKFWNGNNPWGFYTYNMGPFIRTAASDSRLPALDPATAGATAGPYCLLGDPAWTGQGAGGYDLWCNVDGLKPNTRYTIVLAQMYLEVNGELDALLILNGDPPDAPDELKMVPNGTPQGHPDIPCVFAFFSDIQPDANPWVPGYADSDAGGNLDFDCVPRSGGGGNAPTWWRGAYAELADGNALRDSTPFMPNEGFATPKRPFQFNYWYLVEGEGTEANPVPTGPIAVRTQMGPDLRSDYTPHFDGWADYPTGPGTVSSAPSLVLRAENLDPLSASGVYQLWMYQSSDGTVVPLTAREVKKINTDTGDEEVIATDAAAAVNGGDPNEAFEFTIFMADNPGTLTDYDHLLITIEDAVATTPSSETNLYQFYYDTSDPTLPVAIASGQLTFGHFDLSLGTPGRQWGFAGSGLANFFGDQFRARTTNMVRPIEGYAYYGWLVGSDPESGSPFYASLGPLTAEYPTYASLEDADITRDIPSASESVVTETGIAVGINYMLMSDIVLPDPFSGEHPFCNVTEYWVTLQPKTADLSNPGPTVAIRGATPESFTKSAACVTE